MLENSDIVATCWNEDLLVGIARSITDFNYCCYLSDLTVDVAFQRQGIGTELISLTQSLLGPRCKIVILSAPAAAITIHTLVLSRILQPGSYLEREQSHPKAS